MKKLVVFRFSFPLFFLPHIFHLSFVRALFFLFWSENKNIYLCIHSFILYAILLQTVRSHCVSGVAYTICPYDYANFQWKIDDFFFTTQYFFLFTIHWKTSQLNRFPFFPFVLKWHAEKFLVGWLWNIVIGGFARKRVSVCGFLFYSKRHSINVENPIPNSNFIEIIDLKKLFQIDSSLRFWE